MDIDSASRDMIADNAGHYGQQDRRRKTARKSALEKRKKQIFVDSEKWTIK